MKQLIEDLISALEYHAEQTRPIHSTTVAIQAAREAAKAMQTQRKPLTLEAIKKLMPEPDSKGWIYTECQVIETVRRVEAAHRITEKGGSS
jgi:hypothetical protein